MLKAMGIGGADLMKTMLKHWIDTPVKGLDKPIKTLESWEIPEGGAEIFCTSWPHGQPIRPYGDGWHVVVGLTVYHCDEFMKILEQQVENGFEWGIEGVQPTRGLYADCC